MRKWIKAFLDARGLSSPDGRHLFAYQMTPDEFRSLEDMLTKHIEGCVNINKALGMPIDDVFDFGRRSIDLLDAAFVLYAAAWWQQRYEGHFAWQPVMDAVHVGNHWQNISITDHIRHGMSYWGLPLNDEGFRFLGTIAREAGLPLKLLHGHDGVLSGIFRSVLKEAMKADAGRDMIERWIDNAKEVLPAAYRCQGGLIVGIMADIVVAVRDLKTIQASMKETPPADDRLDWLSRIDPHWQARFPLPLHDEAALGLLRFLFSEADQGPSKSERKTLIVVGRSIGRTISDDDAEAWNLSATVVIPERCRIDGLPDKFASGTMTLHMDGRAGGGTPYELILRQDANDTDVYVGRHDDNPVLSGAAAADDVIVDLINRQGLSVSRCFPGGEGLDRDLPWVFESGDIRNTFVRQGGGTVGGVVAYVALADGWRVDGEAVRRGSILGLPRTVWEISGSVSVTNDAGLSFPVRFGGASDACSYVWEGPSPRFVRRPVNAFKGLPAPVRYLDGGTMSPLKNVRLQWRYPSEHVFSDVVPGQRFGVMDVWDRSPHGGNLRSRMLILPRDADIRFESVGERRGRIVLSRWQASDVALASGQPSVVGQVERNGDDHLVTVDAVPGAMPPQDVTLLVYWHGGKEHAEVVVPFPVKGARLFGPEGEIPHGGSLCVSELYGLRLYCFPNTCLELVFSFGGKEFATRFTPDRNAIGAPLLVGLSTYQGQIQRLLSLGTGIDAAVRMSVRDNGFDTGCSWTIRRYAAELEFDAGDMLLKGACPGEGGYGTTRLQAICLAGLSAGTREFIGRESEGVPVGRWTVGDELDVDGPWLFYDANPNTMVRPKVVPWHCDGRPVAGADRLESAMLAAPAERPAALASCLEAMACEPDAREWDAFAKLMQALGHLPLSTLDAWQAAITSGRVMATMAMRMPIDLTRRMSSELGFLWETVSLDDWRHAMGHCKAWLKRLSDEELANDILHKQREKVLEVCPACRALMAAGFPIDGKDGNELRICRMHFTLPVFRKDLFDRTEHSASNTMLIRHADEDEGRWPHHYDDMVKAWRSDTALSRLFPPEDAFDASRDGVLLLPIVLGVRACTGNASLLAIGRDDMFWMQRYKDFDNEWFEACFKETVLCCLAEHFTL